MIYVICSRWNICQRIFQILFVEKGALYDFISWEYCCGDRTSNIREWILYGFWLRVLLHNLKTKVFKEMTEEWLQFVVDCRRGIRHEYDIVEGPMADDTIWDYVEDYMAGRISKAAFWELVKFKYPTHQIVFCTERALQTIKFERSYSL